jgi:hypothetical protein
MVFISIGIYDVHDKCYIFEDLRFGLCKKAGIRKKAGLDIYLLMSKKEPIFQEEVENA